MSEKRESSASPSGASKQARKKQASSVLEIDGNSAILTSGSNTNQASNSSDSKFGTRLLSSEKDIFEHNAWDHVEPDDEHLKYAEEQIRMHHENPVPKDEKEKYNKNPAHYWDSFYAINQNRFFKDRHWLRIEFGELFEWTDKRISSNTNPKEGIKDKSDAIVQEELTDVNQKDRFRIMEVGCGAGNAAFPLLADIYDPRLFVYACDFSKTAIDVVKSNPKYTEKRCSAFTWDLASTTIPEGIEPGSLDIVLMIFVFSALHPDQWRQAVDNVYTMLKPGGILLFRDYGRHDLAQLRFKKSRLLDENFYIRGDGTRVYFFTNNELSEIFGSKFVVEQNSIDRRLLVNRKNKKKMYRVWLQGKFIKSK